MTTNYEWIKNMTVEEMAEFLKKITNCGFCNLYLDRKRGRNTDNFYNKYTPDEQYEKFGIRSVYFIPFKDMDYVWEQDHDTYTIDECQETLKEYAHSTIYQGFRYFFKDLESLKNFCEMAEKGILK